VRAIASGSLLARVAAGGQGWGVGGQRRITAGGGERAAAGGRDGPEVEGKGRWGQQRAEVEGEGRFRWGH
jgi:hypothetical protein